MFLCWKFVTTIQLYVRWRNRITNSSFPKWLNQPNNNKRSTSCLSDLIAFLQGVNSVWIQNCFNTVKIIQEHLQEYFQSNIGRKIRIFSEGRKQYSYIKKVNLFVLSSACWVRVKASLKSGRQDTPVFDLHKVTDQTVCGTALDKIPLSVQKLFWIHVPMFLWKMKI